MYSGGTENWITKLLQNAAQLQAIGVWENKNKWKYPYDNEQEWKCRLLKFPNIFFYLSVPKSIEYFKNSVTIILDHLHVILLNVTLFIIDILVDIQLIYNCYVIFYPRGRWFDSRYFHNFNSGLGLERGPSSLVRSIG